MTLTKDILEQVAKLIKKDKDIDSEPLSNREKAMVIDVLKSRYSTTRLLMALHMTKSNYFYQRAAMKKDS